MSAAVNVSYGLNNYAPFLTELQDCTFAHQVFNDIYMYHCPGLTRYSKWIYVGLEVVSAAVMLSVILWVIYGRERKQHLDGNESDRGAVAVMEERKNHHPRIEARHPHRIDPPRIDPPRIEAPSHPRMEVIEY